MLPEKKNKLIDEHSPYLLMHADNPVNWYPWGDEAFALAHNEDKPVFLSIGYASCHWCHVMEEESFRDKGVADLLNRYFISVKVDREERPDLDQVYMQICQMMTGNGGWPLSLFLTPEKKPFYAATYIPRTSRPGSPGMIDILPEIAQLWREKRSEILDAGRQIIVSCSTRQGTSSLLHDLLVPAVTALRAAYDPVNGGIGSRPKFPSIPQILFLLRYGRISGDPGILQMAVKTLNRMASGGIRDHLGGGFHRYATDPAWRLPHFEKMLYDQALNAEAYIDAYLLTGEEGYLRVADEIFSYVITRLNNPDGGFFSSEDADSQTGEGGYYLWNEDEIREAVSPERYSRAMERYGITREGNVSGDPGMPAGGNVLYLAEDQDRSGLLLERKEDGEIRESLLSVRNDRERPATDEKILTDWNGLMIRAAARGGFLTGNEQVISSASAAARFITSSMLQEDGTLLHRWYRGHVGITAYAGDYIFLASGILMLFQISGDPAWLRYAMSLEETVYSLMWDPTEGGFYQQSSGGDLPIRMKDMYDNAMPSVNGSAYALYTDLFAITGDPRYREKKDKLASCIAREGSRYPPGVVSALAVDSLPDQIRVLIPGHPEIPLHDMIRSSFLAGIPGLVVIPVRDENREELMGLVSDIPHDDRIRICRSGACLQPVSTRGELEESLSCIRDSLMPPDCVPR